MNATISLRDIDHHLIRRGDRFGDLVVECEGQPRHSGVRQMVLMCACGKRALRTVNYLLQARSRGTHSACRLCLLEARSGFFIDIRNKRKEQLLELWRKYGALYSHGYMEWLRETILKELEKALGELPETQEVEEQEESSYLGQFSSKPVNYNFQYPEPLDNVLAPGYPIHRNTFGSDLALSEPLELLNHRHPRRYKNESLVWCGSCGATWAKDHLAATDALWHMPEESVTKLLIWPAGRQVEEEEDTEVVEDMKEEESDELKEIEALLGDVNRLPSALVDRVVRMNKEKRR